MSKSEANAVLLVDDKRYILDMLITVCSEIERPYFTAENGKEALKIYQEHSEEIGLVVSDMVMPIMDGKQLFFGLKDINPKMKIILCSGYPVKSDIKEYIENGDITFLKKPYEMAELLSLLEKH
jgi:two-component system cell cycle sensor histidine kinase/response regulator CckA